MRKLPALVWRIIDRALAALNVLPPERPLSREIAPGETFVPRDPSRVRLHKVISAQLLRVQVDWEELGLEIGRWKGRFGECAERYLGCGFTSGGFTSGGYARYVCGSCKHVLKVPFSCRTRLCPSCVRKRMNKWSAWLASDVLLDLPHRHWVFTLPGELRPHFRDKRWLLNMLSATAARLLMRQLTVRCGEAGAMAGVIAVVQTAGDALTFNPHVHMIATNHALGPSGRLYRVPYIPYLKLCRIWKSAVLSLLRNTGCFSGAEAQKIWDKYPNGFNINGETGDTVRSRGVIGKIAEYLLRPWMAEHRVLSYDGRVVAFKGRGAKNLKTGRRPPIVVKMAAAEFVARLLVQVPPKRQKLVNYYGLYSNKVRGRWACFGYRLRRRKKDEPVWMGWRDQVWRIFNADPLLCPYCGDDLVLEEIVPPNGVP